MKAQPASWTLAHQFGQNVRWSRGALGWSLDELAERAGISKTGLWEIEKGKNMPGIDTALKIARALKIPVGALIDDGPTRPIVDGALLAERIAELYRMTHPGEANQ